MTCNHYKEKLEAYVLGLLSDKERLQLEKHLDNCSSCKQALIKHQRASMLLEKAFDMDAPDYLKTKVLANAKDVQTKSTHWLRWAVSGVAGVIALVLIVQIQPGRMVKEEVGTAHLEEAVEDRDEHAMPSKSPARKGFGLGGKAKEAAPMMVNRKMAPAESAVASGMEAAPGLVELKRDESISKSKHSSPRKKSKKKSYDEAGKVPVRPEMKLGVIAGKQAGQDQAKMISGGAMKVDTDDFMEMEQQFAPEQDANQVSQPSAVLKGRGDGYLSQQVVKKEHSSTYGASKRREQKDIHLIKEKTSKSKKAKSTSKSMTAKYRRAAPASASMKRIQEPAPVVLSKAAPTDRYDQKAVAVKVGLESGASNLDQAHVLRVLEQLENQIKAKLAQEKRKGNYMIEVIIHPNGAVDQVQSVGKTLAHADIIHQIKNLRFGPSGDQKPASITIHIAIK